MSNLEQLLKQQVQLWQSGEFVSVEELIATESRSAGIAVAGDAILNLICNEIRLREQSGVQPLLAEYQRRFPQLAKELETQWEVDAFFDLRESKQHLSVSEQALTRTPEHIGRYEILRELGRGAMGIVYEAYDSELKRTVAIKRLRPQIFSLDVELRRLRTEAEAFAQLRHPNIVQIFDIGEEDGIPFLVMECCIRGTLASHLNGQPQPVLDAARMMLDLTAAISLAHAAFIIHRDLKPANVLLTTGVSGEIVPKVSDFGLAKKIGLDSTMTAWGMVVGSPAYMSPEQADGKTEEITPASDVYSLGAILYECLTGRPPFRGTSIADTLYQLRHTEYVRVRLLQPRVPRDLETITGKCLSKDAASRYPTAAELHDDLQRFLTGRPILARTERVLQRACRLGRRYPLVSSLSAFSLLLLLGISLGSTLFAVYLNRALTRATQAERTSRLEKADALLGKARGVRLSDKPGRRIETEKILQQAVAIGRDLKQPPEWFAPYRNEAIATMWLSDLHVSQWKRTESIVQASDLDPDNNRTALAFQDGHVEVRDTTSDNLIARFERLANRVAFLKGNRLLMLCSADKSCECWQFEFESPQQQWRIESENTDFHISNDGKKLALGDGDTLTFVDTDSGKILSQTSAVGFKHRTRIAFHPTKPLYLISSHTFNEMQLRRLSTHEVLWRSPLLDDGEGGYYSAVWSADGNVFIAVTGHNTRYETYELDSKTGGVKAIKTILKPTIAGAGNLFSWNGPAKRLISHNNWNSDFALYDAVDCSLLLRTQKYTPIHRYHPQIANSSTNFELVRPLSDSTLIGYLQLELGTEEQLLLAQDRKLSQFAIDPTNRVFAVATNGGITFIDLINRIAIGNLEFENWHAHSLQFDSVGRFYLLSYAAALRFDTVISKKNEFIIDHPRRLMMPVGNSQLTVGRDGEVQAAGYWAGYETSEYAGVWVKPRGELAARKVIGQESGKWLTVDPKSDDILFYFQGRAFQCLSPSYKPVDHCENSLFHGIKYSTDGSHAIAGNRIWRTSNWSQLELPANPLRPVDPALFSEDGQHAVLRNQDEVDQLLDLRTKHSFAGIEGTTLALLPTGGLLVQTNRGLVFRDLKAVSEKLKQVGIQWEGPQFSSAEEAPALSLRLGSDLVDLKSCDQLMQYVNSQTLADTAANPNDAEAAFAAAWIYIERRELNKALDKLNQACQLLPEAVSPRQWRAYVLAAMEKWEQAIADASVVIERTNEPDLRLLRAEWSLNVGRPDQALVDIDAAESANELLKRRCAAMRVLTYRELGDHQQEWEWHEKYRIGIPDDQQLADAILPMVANDLSLRRRQLATYMASFLTLTNDPNVANSLAWVHLRNSEYEKALETVAVNLQDTKNWPYPYGLCLAANCNARLGNWELARQQLSELARPEALAYLGTSHGDLAKLQPLIAEAQTVVADVAQTPE